MAKLIAKTALAARVPLSIGSVSLDEIDLGVMTSIMPFSGQDATVSKALDRAVGSGLPQIGRLSQSDTSRVLWFGRGQFLLCGPVAPEELLGAAALSDQSDAWVCAELAGAGAEAVLARLVPLDLRREAFPDGSVARSLIGHMNGFIARLGDDRFLLMVFRSMADTFVHDLTQAMETVAALR